MKDAGNEDHEVRGGSWGGATSVCGVHYHNQCPPGWSVDSLGFRPLRRKAIDNETRANRGGAWLGNSSSRPETFRYRLGTNGHYEGLGFRVICHAR